MSPEYREPVRKLKDPFKLVLSLCGSLQAFRVTQTPKPPKEFLEQIPSIGFPLYPFRMGRHGPVCPSLACALVAMVSLVRLMPLDNSGSATTVLSSIQFVRPDFGILF